MPVAQVERVQLSKFEPPVLVFTGVSAPTPQFVLAETYIVHATADSSDALQYRIGESEGIDEVFGQAIAKERVKERLLPMLRGLSIEERVNELRFEPVDPMWLSIQLSVGRYLAVSDVVRFTDVDDLRNFVRSARRARVESKRIF